MPGRITSESAFIYQFRGIYRVKEPGRYVFGQELTCGFSHNCLMQLSVDDQRLISFDGEAEKNIVRQGIPLTVGDHKVEFKTFIPRNSFIKYEPKTRFQWTPLVQAPGDFNLREYRTDELFAVVPQSVKSPVLGCNY